MMMIASLYVATFNGTTNPLSPSAEGTLSKKWIMVSSILETLPMTVDLRLPDFVQKKLNQTLNDLKPSSP